MININKYYCNIYRNFEKKNGITKSNAMIHVNSGIAMSIEILKINKIPQLSLYCNVPTSESLFLFHKRKSYFLL